MKTIQMAVMVAVLLVLQGCASWTQSRDSVVIRAPGDRTDQAPVPLRDVAPTLYTYAAMSANVYRPAGSATASRPRTTAAFETACAKDSKVQLPLGTAWEEWTAFPAQAQQLDDEHNLRAQLWRHKGADAKIDELVVVFRGTEFKHGDDWKANLRWFRSCQAEDHYTLTAGTLAKELQQLIASEREAGNLSSSVRIATTGHSLGGGLAQHMAYSFLAPEGEPVKPAKVVAFDPSPVTGWSCVDPALRERNAKGLEIDRAYEDGEVLSYLREFIAALVPPSAENPAIRGVRFNVKRSPNPVSNHSMKLLACALAKAAYPSAAELDLQPLESEGASADDL